jgi:hypothetical protein
MELEKNLWTQDDFEDMDWHDNKIYAIAFNNEKFELSFDIDYICKWETKKKSFSFWVAPATLIFTNVYELNITTDSLDLTIMDIVRDTPVTPKNATFIDAPFEYDWTIETTIGEITFKSVGFRQLIRSKPVRTKQQNLNRRNGEHFFSE